MRLIRELSVGVALLVMPGFSVAAIVNYAPAASGAGLLPNIAISGNIAGLYDQSFWAFNSVQTSPRANTASLQPYLTWSTDQAVHVVRVMNDSFSNNYERVFVDTLGGTLDPTIEANWTQRYDTGLLGTAQQTVDIDLGATYNTRGVRVRVNRAGGVAGDFAVGETEVYGNIGGSLTNLRVNPTGWAASSTLGGTSPSFAGQWPDRWLSQSQANNGGSEFTLDRTLNAADINLLSIAWLGKSDNGTRVVPSQWTVAVTTTGNPTFTDVGTFFSSINGLGNTKTWYYNELGDLQDVTALRIRVPFSALPDANAMIGVGYSEMFNYTLIPEPSGIVLLTTGIAMLAARRRR